jgi:prevent-host-death family protein
MAEPRTISVSRFKATCLQLLEQVRQTGQPLIITKRGVPIAHLGPVKPAENPDAWLGCLTDQMKILGDITEPVVDSDQWEALSD